MTCEWACHSFMQHTASRELLPLFAVHANQPYPLQDDKHMQHGQLVLSAHQSKVPLERLLAVAKLAVTFLTDMLRQSEDAQVNLQHLLSV